MDTKKNNLKRYIVSSIVTFLSGVGLVLLSNIDSITMETFKDGSLFGIAFMAIRTGIKMVLELFLKAE